MTLIELFSSNDFNAFFFSGILLSALITTAVHKKVKMPIHLILCCFAMFFVSFITFAAGVSQFYLILIVLSVAGVTTMLANNIFLGSMGSDDKIFMGYLIFFSISIFFLNSLAFRDFPVYNCTGFDVVCFGSFITGFFGFSSPIHLVNSVIVIPFIFFIGKYAFKAIVSLIP